MNTVKHTWFKSLFSMLLLLSMASLSHAAEIVHLNKANAAAFQQNLIGIGPIKAEAIVKYRSKNGSFKKIDDLINVDGIGPALIKKNKRYLSLSKGVSKGDEKAYAVAKKQARSSTSTKKKATSSSKKSTAKKDTKSKSTSTKTSSKTAKSSAKKPAKNSSSSKSSDKKPAKKKPAKKKSSS